jgi:hypothetical protein
MPEKEDANRDDDNGDDDDGDDAMLLLSPSVFSYIFFCFQNNKKKTEMSWLIRSVRLHQQIDKKRNK